VPKTLIFAKDDSHAEDIVDIVRKEFGKGNDFCKKITYKASGKSENIIKAFRTAPEFRIAVTVDMIATGTDIKPLECLLFLRDVRSQLYFEQMKGRGTRTIDTTDLATVTPDAGSKTRFVLVDAVGVTESDKTDSRPLERKPTVAFEKLLQNIALGVRDEDTLTSLANRLARLDRSLSDSDKAELVSTGGISLKKLASDLLKATDPDEIERATKGRDDCPQSSAEPPTADDLQTAALDLANEATKPLAANPAFRDLLEKKRRNHEVTIDHISSDELIATGYDEEKARGLIQNWQQFLEDNQDEITALQILYNKPHAKRHLVYEELKALVEAVGKPPYHIAPAEVWAAYEHLEKRPISRDPVKILTNLISLVRHTVDHEHQPLTPFPQVVEKRFQQWLIDQDDRFNEPQRNWLDIIKNTIALNGAFPTDEKEDYLEAWQNIDSNEGVPLAVAKRVFGEDPKAIIEELNQALIA
jgi:type I restriction enzyme R subunit